MEVEAAVLSSVIAAFSQASAGPENTRQVTGV